MDPDEIEEASVKFMITSEHPTGNVKLATGRAVIFTVWESVVVQPLLAVSVSVTVNELVAAY